MNYVFCSSYAILFFALYLKEKGKKLTVITYNNNIAKYCKVEKINCIKYDQIVINPRSFHKIFSFKKNLDKLIDRIDFGRDDRFYLMGNRKQLNGFYLSRNLSKKGTVFYYSMSLMAENQPYSHSKCKPFFLRWGFLRILVKIILGVDLVYYQGHGIPVIGVGNKFFENNDIKKYNIDLLPREIIQKVVSSIDLNCKKVDNLIVDDGPIEKIVKRKTLVEIYDKIFELPITFAFKEHPVQIKRMSDSKYYCKFKDFEKIPEYYPVELFLKNVRKNVIAVYSSSLIIGSKLPNIKTISLLDLVEWHDESFKNHVKSRLTEKSDNKILFPNDFNELKNILLNKK